jgi:hypothetical protein
MKTYKDNAMNRRLGRVGLQKGSKCGQWDKPESKPKKPPPPPPLKKKETKPKKDRDTLNKMRDEKLKKIKEETKPKKITLKKEVPKKKKGGIVKTGKPEYMTERFEYHDDDYMSKENIEKREKESREQAEKDRKKREEEKKKKSLKKDSFNAKEELKEILKKVKADKNSYDKLGEHIFYFRQLLDDNRTEKNQRLLDKIELDFAIKLNNMKPARYIKDRATWELYGNPLGGEERRKRLASMFPKKPLMSLMEQMALLTK